MLQHELSTNIKFLKLGLTIGHTLLNYHYKHFSMCVNYRIGGLT